MNSASGFVLSLGKRHFVGTAWHVVEAWLSRSEAGEDLLFQVGHADLPPRHRVAFKDVDADVAFLEIDQSDIQRIGASPCEPLRGWPPQSPKVGDSLLIAGYPSSERLHRDSDAIEFGVFSGLISVTAVHDTHLSCQFQREHWIASDGIDLPPEGADLGGMSGGPALLVCDLSYPLVGLVAQHNHMFEIMRVTTFANVVQNLA